MKTLTPFADDAVSIGAGDLTIENGTDQVSLHGALVHGGGQLARK